MGIDDIYNRRTGYSYTWGVDDIFRDLYSISDPTTKVCSEKLDEILLNVLLDFSGSPIRIIHYPVVDRTIKNKIVIENSDKRTYLEYNLGTHEFSGFLEMSLGDRDLTEITKEEVEIIQRALLVWIYENI